MILRKLGCLFLGLGAWPGLFHAVALSGEEKPYRQYPELPDVLYYEGFETSAVTWKGGAVDTTVVQRPGNHSYKLAKVKQDKDEVFTASVDLPVKFPAGMEPNEVYIQFMLCTDQPGELSVKLKEGDWEEKPRSFKTNKTWWPVLMKVAEFHKDKSPRPTKASSFNGVALTYKLKASTEKAIPEKANTEKASTENFFIDDFIISYRTPPANLLPALAALEAKRATLVRSIGDHGFTFNPQIKETMQSVFKRLPARKARTVLIVGAKPKDTEDLVKGMNASPAKLKAQGLNFVAATGPDGSCLGGLDDMRTLLSYSARKNEAEMALLMLGNADAEKPGRPSENVRAVLERALEANCVPIVCLPPSEEGGKVNGFISSVNNACIALSLPWIDEGFGLKEVKNAFDGKELAAPGLEKFSELAVLAIKHMEGMATGRR